VSRANANTALSVLETWLEESPLEGADAVRAAVARRLASALESAPDYAVARIAAVLSEIVGAIQTPDQVDAERALRDALTWLRAPA
jgi:hypothetical protein